MKPGLYVATVRGVEGAHIWCDGSGDSTEFFLLAAEERSRWLDDAEVTDARLPVVLDPESTVDLKRLLEAVKAHGVTSAALRALAAPTTAEPMGLGAVVRDARGRLWVNNPLPLKRDANPWRRSDGLEFAEWSEIDFPVVLSEGWTP